LEYSIGSGVSTSRSGRLLREKEPLFFLLPGLIALLAIVIAPLVYSLFMTFHDYILITQRPPVFNGINNLIRMVQDERFLNSVKVTTFFSLGALLLELLLGLAITVLLTFETKVTPYIRTIFIMIVVTPYIVVGYIWKILLNAQYSPINYLLNITLGFPKNFEWISNTQMVIPSLILVDAWQWTPFVVIVLLAGIYAVPLEPQEAAKIDGASYWQILRHIIFPLIRPLVLVVLLIRFMDTIKLFDLIYILTRGGPGTASETISFYTYIMGFKFFDIGYSSAMSWTTVIVVEIICTIFIRFMRRK
jgi:multiple sugar transport system permease protein